MTEENKIKSHCNKCGHQTNHFILFTDKTSDESLEDGNDSTWINEVKLLKCCGCDDISLREFFWHCEMHSFGIEPKPRFYPPRIARKKPIWHNIFSDGYDGLLDEIYNALYCDSRRLVIMGVRSIIDIFISRKVGDQGNFKNGMQKLLDEGFISKMNKETLESVIEMGHATIHREFKPTSEQVNNVIDILENLLHHDILQKSATTLRAVTPQRKTAKK